MNGCAWRKLATSNSVAQDLSGRDTEPEASPTRDEPSKFADFSLDSCEQVFMCPDSWIPAFRIIATPLGLA